MNIQVTQAQVLPSFCTIVQRPLAASAATQKWTMTSHGPYARIGSNDGYIYIYQIVKGTTTPTSALDKALNDFLLHKKRCFECSSSAYHHDHPL